jgi:hypothetical protein
MAPVGVDTHRDTLTAAAVTNLGGVLAHATTSADAAGYRRLLDFAHAHLPGRRLWAVEGTGSFGAGLAGLLQQRGERVVEVGRPKRPAHRTGAKSDALDAVRAAREALGQDHPATPRRRGEREALRVLLTTRRCATLTRVGAIGQLKALIVGAPEELRAELRGRNTAKQIDYCASLRTRPTRSPGAPGHRAGAAGHRPAHPGPADRGRPAASRAHRARQRHRTLVARSPRGRPRERRASAGQLVARRPVPLRGCLCRPGWHQPHPRLLWTGNPPPPQPRRRPAARTAPCTPSCWCACAPIPTPAPTWPAAPPKARAAATPSGACDASSPGSCSDCWSAMTNPASRSSGRLDRT